MIGFMPQIYPDELFYSMIARYYAHSGYYVYRSVAEDCMRHRSDHPSIEFINTPSEDALNIICKQKSLYDFIFENTMAAYYTRFLPLERRVKAWDALQSGKPYHDYIQLHYSSRKGYLRYCPMCVKADRELYGETYWHRIHQIPEFAYCPEHKMLLAETNISLNSKSTPAFISAEDTVVCGETERVMVSQKQDMLTDYILAVLNEPINLKSDIKIGRYLHTRIEHTDYLSRHGIAQNLGLLCRNMNDYYTDADMHGFNKKWQISKLLSSQRTGTFEVCAFAMFISVTPRELCAMEKPAVTQSEEFEKAVLDLVGSGLSALKTGRKLGCSKDCIVATVNYIKRQQGL